MPAPPLSEVAIWLDLIVRRALDEFTPEELIAVYDTRSPSSDSRVVLGIERYILLQIERLLNLHLGYGDLRNDVSERKHLARNSIHDALIDLESDDGRSLRGYFFETNFNRCVDAARKRIQYEQRFTSLEALANDLKDESDSEDGLILWIDLQNMVEAEAHAGRRLALEMTIQGCTQEEIALATGVVVRQVRRWLKSFASKAPKKPDME